MKSKLLFFAVTAALTSSSIHLAAIAQTVNARCDIYPKGEDRASAVVPCTFSQRQGVVGIQLENGKRYDLRPTGNQPGNYLDQNNQPAYRQSGLNDLGQIYRLANESIYVYWNTSGLNPANNNSQSSNPTTYTTVRNFDHIDLQITEGEFHFHGTLTKLPGSDYAGSDGQVRVIFTPNTGRVVVFSEATGQTFYDYNIEPVFLGEDPSTMCDSAVESC
ncbi:MAG: hypothetical protein SAJ37_04010 [Oscillatoria sp. PMC 1068.18]|nr:hypothetical protein [Oscillatoria sp. PMC 1076.18]MEC4987891.1 hypothetical protein [Oscillatoria sp. PMC 1068.18]